MSGMTGKVSTFWVCFEFVLGMFTDSLIYSVNYDGWATQNLSNMSLGCPQSIWVQVWGLRNGRKGQNVLVRFGTFQDNLIYSVSYHGWTTQNSSNMSLGRPQSIWVQVWGVRNGWKGNYVLVRFGTFQGNLIYSISYDGWTTQNLSNMYFGCPQSIWAQVWGVKNGRKGQNILVRFGTFQDNFNITSTTWSAASRRLLWVLRILSLQTVMYLREEGQPARARCCLCFI